MTINELNQEGSTSTDPKEEVVSGTTQSLGTSLNSEDLLNKYDKLNADIVPYVVEIREMRDNVNYKAKDVLIKMLEFAQKFGYTDLKISDKKIDNDGNLISISLQGKSPKYGGCYSHLNFVKNCSYGENGGSDETCIIEECYEDDSFDIPFDTEIIHKY